LISYWSVDQLIVNVAISRGITSKPLCSVVLLVLVSVHSLSVCLSIVVSYGE